MFYVLVSFTFNLGAVVLQHLTLRRKENRGEHESVPATVWNDKILQINVIASQRYVLWGAQEWRFSRYFCLLCMLYAIKVFS